MTSHSPPDHFAKDQLSQASRADYAPFEEAETNAGLIAAAPDLLEALTTICTIWIAGGRPGAHMIADGWAAIAKAKGQSTAP